MTATQTQSMIPIHIGVVCDQQICYCPYHLKSYPWGNRGFSKAKYDVQLFRHNLQRFRQPSIKVIPSASDYTMMTLEKRRGTIPPTWKFSSSKLSKNGFNQGAQSLPMLLPDSCLYSQQSKALDQTKELSKNIPKTIQVINQGGQVADHPYSSDILLNSVSVKDKTQPVDKKNSKTSIDNGDASSPSCDIVPRKRVKDDEGYIRRAACVCVNEDETKVLLISSKTDGKGWLIPGGGLEDGEPESEAAIREAWEEAGVTGSIDRWLGIFQSEDEITHKKKRTSVFVLKVSNQENIFPESDLGRRRQWYPIEEAKTLLSISKPNQIAYLDALQ